MQHVFVSLIFDTSVTYAFIRLVYDVIKQFKTVQCHSATHYDLLFKDTRISELIGQLKLPDGVLAQSHSVCHMKWILIACICVYLV